MLCDFGFWGFFAYQILAIMAITAIMAIPGLSQTYSIPPWRLAGADS